MSVVENSDTGNDTIAELSLEERAAKFFGPSASPVKVDVGAMSHPGKRRPNNEDHYGVVRRCRSRDVLLTNLPDGFLPHSEDVSYALAVADGIGGAAFGELASMLALRTAWDLTTSAFKWPFRLNETEAHDITEALEVYGQLMHRRVVEQGRAEPHTAGMGTTLTGAVTVGREVFIAHIGDSRAYLFRDGSLERLTRDHTMAQQMVDAGVIASVSHASRLMQHMLVNCLGGNRDEVEVDVSRVQLDDGDRLLLCTDGLSDMVSDDEIAQILNSRPAPQDACQALVDMALDHGGKDNVTVVLARFAFGPDRAAGTRNRSA